MYLRPGGLLFAYDLPLTMICWYGRAVDELYSKTTKVASFSSRKSNTSAASNCVCASRR